MAKISETQRNYFINRVENSIKDEINYLNKLFGYVNKLDHSSLNTYYCCTKIPENVY